MELIRNFTLLRPQHRNCVATIGNFDGVHRGHQIVLQLLVRRAKEFCLPSVVILFEPQPLEFFAPDKAPPRLTRWREKVTVMQHQNIDRLLFLRFRSNLANLSAEQFIQYILIDGLNIEHLVVGDDFHFGQGRQGNFGLLQQAGQRYGFSVESQRTFLVGEERVSSTRIRQALVRGDMSEAAYLLGRPFSMWGRVRYGQQLGRTIGFPTANIYLRRQVSPLNGVFAVKVHKIAEQPLHGVANLGKRPTVDGNHLVLETHLFDFKENIYGRMIEVEFVHKLRDEKKFTSFDELKQQIIRDAQAAREILG